MYILFYYHTSLTIRCYFELEGIPMNRIFRILNKIFVLKEESRYYPKLEKITLDKSGLILLGIGVVIFLMGLSVHDKQLMIENGNAIVGALLGIIGLILVYLGFYSRFSRGKE
jgi:hypothetical protein